MHKENDKKEKMYHRSITIHHNLMIDWQYICNKECNFKGKTE